MHSGHMKKSLLLAALLLTAACSRADPAVLLGEAKTAFAAEDYGTARTSLLAALDVAGADKAMLLLLARSQLRLGDGDGAKAALVQLESASGKTAESTRMMAEAALLRGQPDEALELLGNDADPEAWRVRAAAHAALEDSPAALAAMRKGLAAGGNYALLHDYAVYQMAAQDYAGAEGTLAKMRVLGPERLDTLMVSGDLAVNQGRFGAASRAYLAAKAKFPARSEPLAALATLADMQGKLDEAIALVEQAAKISPRSTQVEALRVQFAAQHGDWEKVRTMLAGQESALEPRSANGMSYAEALLRLGHAEQARALFAKALSLSPQNPFARLMLAEAELETGDAASALRTIQPLSASVMADTRALELASKAARGAGDPSAAGLAARLASPQTRINQTLVAAGEAAAIRGDWRAAIAAYRQLPGYDGDAEVLKRLALASSKAGLHAEAIAFADKALALAPRNPDMPHIAGLVRLEAGQNADQARQLMAQAVQLDPSNRLFRADLGRAGGGAS